MFLREQRGEFIFLGTSKAMTYLIFLGFRARLLLLFFENFLRHERGGHRRRPSGVKGHMGDNFRDLGLGDAVAERAFDMHSKLLRTIQGDQRRYGYEAAVALGELGPLPDVAEDDFIRELDRAWEPSSGLFRGANSGETLRMTMPLV